jgi:hypothetical protein
MKYSVNSLDLALDYLLPSIRKAKEVGVSFDRPSLCKMAAQLQFVKIVLKDEIKDEYSFRKAYQTSLCEYVVAEALQDLNTAGYFIFGEKDLSQDVNLEENN